MNLNESDLENIFKTCRDSPSTWLTAYGIYVFVISSTINGFIIVVDQFMVIIEHVRRFYRNRGFYQNENIEEVSESDFHYFCIFVYQQIAVIFLYVFGAFVFHSMMSDTRINSILVARWWMEATIDFPCFVALINAWVEMFILCFGSYRDYLTGLNEMLLVAKIHQFYLLRYPEFHPESKLNSLLVCVFRHFCIASHHSRFSDQPLWTFFVKFRELRKDLPFLFNEIE